MERGGRASWSTATATCSTSAASSSAALATATFGSSPNVSRHHAEIRQEGATYWVVDLESTNGVEVNGRRVKRAKLEDADRMTMGSTELVFSRSFQ